MGSGWVVWRGGLVSDDFGEGVGEGEGSASIVSVVNVVSGTWQMGSR